MHARLGSIFSTFVIVWLATVLVKVENQRYALTVGMCRDVHGLTDLRCLQTVETRTGWWCHLFYALDVL